MNKPLLFSNTLIAICLAIFLASASANAQMLRQTSFSIDDGNGNFIQLISQSLTGGGEVLSFPNTGGAAANILLSTSLAGQTIAGGLTVTGGLTSGAFTLPTATGSIGDVITSDGAGGSSWQPAGFTPQLIDIYTTNTQTVFLLSNVLFSTTGYVSGLTFNGSSAITVNATGVYEIEFSIYTTTVSSSVEIFQNGTAVPGTRVACGANALSHFSAIIQCTAGDIINLRNANNTNMTLQTPASGELTASLEMKRVQ